MQILDGTCSPPILTLTTKSPSFISSGTWNSASSNDALNGEYVYVSNDELAEASWDIDIPSTGLYEIAIWSPQSTSFTDSATIVVNSYTGLYSFNVSQQSYGGRWYKLGDFYLVSGNQKVVTIHGSSSSVVVANAIKISKWPECRHSPGATCEDFNPSGPICPELY